MRMVFPGVRLSRAGSTVVEYWQFSIGWVRTLFGEGGGQLDR